ncbi:efflux RND transporter periplasmic adaptor subunit [Rhodosalinus sp. K401]|uniref:efflux RND transporter periplasmic adaptor subunit n=1 Tax=Rhodosalinus sp. K401 TaxID=3239195 RepID=UPI0035257E86
MAESFHSSSWYRVAEKRPRLRSHTRFFRTLYRGELWYVLQDRTSGRYHRFSPSSYFVASLLDGKRTLEDAWQIAQRQLDDDTLSQDKIIEILGQLHGADVLQGEGVPDIAEMVERGERQRRKKTVKSVMNPLAIRLPLIDPEGFLRVTMPLARPFFSVAGLLLYLGLLGYGITLAAVHWDELTSNVLDRVLSTENIVLLLLVYPLVKAIHELGHAYAITRWGGEVHEIGIMFLVFMPVPYVDASDSLSFPSKWRRAFVAGAGILVEIGLAAIAMIVWVNAESGLVSAFAFNVMLIGGVSTLFFNGNPLLRFDGYYVLSDILEIPNLGQRSNRYIGYLVQKHMLGIEEAKNPATAPGEAGWFFVYALAAFAYRIFITVVIVLLVSSMFFSLGILLAVWSVVLMFGVPLAKQVWFLFASPKLRRRRGRALAIMGGTLGAVMAALLLVPLPYSTISEGVLWVPGEAAVHAGTDGLLEEVLVAQGETVEAGAPLVRMADPLLMSRVRLLEVTVEELNRRREALLFQDPAAARIVERELEHAAADLALARDRLAALDVRAETAGRVALEQTTDLPGRFVRKGAILGYVADPEAPLVRAVVNERDSDLVRRARRIDVRFASDPESVWSAHVTREIPSLVAELPSMALATIGGGRVALDPAAPDRALANLMHLELGLDAKMPFETIGQRAYVRFVHDPTPVAERVYRRVRQVFLRHFKI